MEGKNVLPHVKQAVAAYVPNMGTIVNKKRSGLA